ncbi:MAG: hypothetical protein ACRDRH_13695 [Pseudonocardia sp.]
MLLRYLARRRGDRSVVDLALVNAQAQLSGTPDTARLYPAGLTVTSLYGSSPVFVGANDPELGERPAARDHEQLHLALLYRHQRLLVNCVRPASIPTSSS